MKYFFLILLFSCSKIQVQQCKQVGYLIEHWEAGKLVSVDTSIWWPSVCGEELKRFEAVKVRREAICGTSDTLKLVIK